MGIRCFQASLFSRRNEIGPNGWFRQAPSPAQKWGRNGKSRIPPALRHFAGCSANSHGAQGVNAVHGAHPAIHHDDATVHEFRPFGSEIKRALRDIRGFPKRTARVQS